MAINWTNGDFTSGQTLTHTLLNTIKSDVAGKFNAGITTADLNASAAITNAQLANKHYEIVVNMTIDGVQWTAANAGDKVAAVAGLPADVDAAGYTIVQVDWLFRCNTEAIAAAPAFSLDWGYFGTDSTWTQTDSIDTAQSLGTLTANQGSCGTCSLVDDSLVMSDSNVNFLALLVSTVGDFDHGSQLLTVSIKLKRTNGLRS